MSCTKCHEEGHKFSQCTNDWVCNLCKQAGHKQTECTQNKIETDTETDAEGSESDCNQTPTRSSKQTTSSTEKKTPSADQEASSTEQTKSIPDATPLCAREASTTRSSSNSRQSKQTDKQISMDRFVGKHAMNSETPNKTRVPNVTVRSPPTPVDELHDRVTNGKQDRKRNK